MAYINSTERIINTFEGKQLDRLPVFDIIHNIDFVEKVTGQKVTRDNAEDLICQAVADNLDMVRHFRIPDFFGQRISEDEDGFRYREEWWTKQVTHIPLNTLDEAREMMEKDIHRIYSCIEKGKFCFQAFEQLNLFNEYFLDPEELNRTFKRLSDKLGDTVMIAPETVPGLYTATHRYSYEWVTYMYYDYYDTFSRYYDALVDHELFRIDCFGPTKLTKVAMISEALAFNTGLIWPMEFIKKEVYPRIKKCIDRWKKYGYYVIFHSDGNKWQICKDIIEMGADSINPFEPLATMDIAKFRKLYPDTVCGSMIDCQNLLAYGKPEDVRDATRKAIENSGGSRTLIGSTSEIHPSIPVDNALAMYEVARGYRL